MRTFSIPLTIISLAFFLTACPSISIGDDGGNGTPQPKLTVEPDSIELSFADDDSVDVTLLNSGAESTTLDWSATASDFTKDGEVTAPWFSISPSSGSIAGGGSQILTLTITQTFDSPATYRGSIIISHNAGDDVVVPVVLEDAALSMATAPLSFATTGEAGFTLQNTANASTLLNYRLKSKQNYRDDEVIEQWYTASPQQGQIPGGTSQTITLTLKPELTGAPGFYESVLCVEYGANYGRSLCFSITFDKSDATTTGSFTLAYDSNQYAIPPVPPGVVIGRVPVEVVRANNFAAPVTLTAQVEPAANIGVQFNPNPVDEGTNQSLLTITVNADVPIDDYVITVTGRANGKDSSVEIPLTVQQEAQPNFSLELDNSSLSIRTGERAQATVNVKPVAGFTGDVSFSAVTPNDGVRVSFSPNPSRTGTTATIQVDDSVPAGSYALTIRGRSGSLQDDVALNLEVVRDSDPENARMRGVIVTANNMRRFTVPDTLPQRNALAPAALQEAYADYVPYQILVKYKDDALGTLSTEDRLEFANRYALTMLEAGDSVLPHLFTTEQKDIEALAEALSRDPRVAYAEPNYYLYAQSIPSDPLYNEQWYMASAGVPVAWQAGNDSSAKTIAVLDSGIDTQHSGFAGVTFYEGYDFCASFSNNTCTEDSTPLPTSNTDRHGTHVTGIIAASSDGRGMAGVVHEGARILPVKVFHNGGQTNARAFTRALLWAGGVSVDRTPTNSHPADIINLSLGATVDAQSLREAVETVANRGVLMIAAAGNAGSNELLYPAAYPQVMAVGSVNSDFRRSCFSQYGNNTESNAIDIMAGGGDYRISTSCSSTTKIETIISTIPNSEYAYDFGTSQATPVVTGVAALVWQQNPGWSASQVRERLKATAYYDSSYMNRSEYGAGIVRADAALGLPSVGDAVSLTATGRNQGDTALDTVTLTREGRSTEFVLSDLLADSYTIQADANGAKGDLSGTTTVTLTESAQRDNLTITIAP